MTGRSAAKNSSMVRISPCMYRRSSDEVNTEAMGSERSASTAEKTTVRATETATVYRNASRIMSNRPIPYSAEHTASIAPPRAWAAMKMKFAIRHPVEYIPTASVPPQSITM